MTRFAAGLAGVALLVGCACTRQESGPKDAASAPDTLQVDPMAFVVVYHADFERLLHKHENDCEGALAALMRFVADHRQAFQDRVQDKPPDWQPHQVRSRRGVNLLMDFGARCPQQVARLNQAIHSVIELPDGS